MAPSITLLRHLSNFYSFYLSFVFSYTNYCYCMALGMLISLGVQFLGSSFGWFLSGLSHLDPKYRSGHENYGYFTSILIIDPNRFGFKKN